MEYILFLQGLLDPNKIYKTVMELKESLKILLLYFPFF